MLKSKYVAVSDDSSFLVGLHHEQVPEDFNYSGASSLKKLSFPI